MALLTRLIHVFVYLQIIFPCDLEFLTLEGVEVHLGPVIFVKDQLILAIAGLQTDCFPHVFA